MTEDKELLNSDEEQWAALIAAIGESPGFKNAPKRRQLLEFLFQNRNTLLSYKQIESDHFGQSLTSVTFDPSRSRMACMEIRAELKNIGGTISGHNWRCELPKANTIGGAKLVFDAIQPVLSASQKFLQPHLDTLKDTLLISGSHLFLFEPDDALILRYYDFNPTSDDQDEVYEQLLVEHPENDGKNLEPWHDVYLASGDVQAHEAFQRWFHEQRKVLIRRVTSRQIPPSEVHRRTPILVGRPQTNPFIKRMMRSPQASQLGYRIHDQKGTIRITNILDSERQQLGAFPISPDGIIGPVTGLGYVFGIITRMKNPGGYGSVTIIACDYYAMVIARIAEALTDEKHAQNLLDQMGWTANQVLPDFFEMLFTVTLSPGNLEGEGYPQLVAWRLL